MPRMKGMSLQQFQNLARPVFGRSNPELVDNPLWEAAFREELGGYSLRKAAGDPRRPRGGAGNRAAHRLAEDGPIWCWQRYGQTRTDLPDGRVVHIGGEHEDWYDPDFCIFNDVVVEHDDGTVDIYAYPLDAFPPTDFHTATLIDGAIILIGNLGYRDERRPGICQVARLDLESFRIDLLECDGPSPGWLSRHMAERLGEREILVLGGQTLAADDPEEGALRENGGLFALDIDALRWRRVPHAEPAILPVSAEDYLQGKSPVTGAANPQKLDHPVKREAARRNWRPIRTRLHFGDPAPRRPDDPKAHRETRPIDQVVWTAERTGAAHVALPEGGRLVIAGEFRAFDEEWADSWVYSDVVRHGPDGSIDIFAYPVEVVPPLFEAVAMAEPDHVLIFGRVIHRFEPRARQTVTLRLDLASMAVTLLDAVKLPTPVLLDLNEAVISPETIGFKVMRRAADDPERVLWFDRAPARWRET